MLNNSVLTRLQKIVETVRDGDAFVRRQRLPPERHRLVVLALQLLSIVIAAIGKFLSTPKYPLDFDAGFSPISWLGVLLMFVLARVFAEGDADARRPRRDGVTWRSPSSSTTCSTSGG